MSQITFEELRDALANTPLLMRINTTLYEIDKRYAKRHVGFITKENIDDPSLPVEVVPFSDVPAFLAGDPLAGDVAEKMEIASEFGPGVLPTKYVFVFRENNRIVHSLVIKVGG